MTIYLVPNISKQTALYVMQQAAEILSAAGVELVVDPLFEGSFTVPGPVRYLPPEAAWTACDMVVTIGGDGTMLHTAHSSMHYQKPLLGINTGHLGFLTVLEKDEVEKLRRLPAGDFLVEQRSTLQYQLEWVPPSTVPPTGDDAANDDALAMNDIVLFKAVPEKAIMLDIYCDDVPVSSFRGDGVIFSTPTGSTAYSMSAGGPIVDAHLGGIIVTQICAHVVQMPPMVFAGSRKLKVVSRGGEAEPVLITSDGRVGRLLPAGVPVWISEADKKVPMVQFRDAGQLRAIDKKLKGR